MLEYRPISCQFYDLIELFAISQKKVSITYLADYQQEQTIEEVIKDTKTTKEGEFIILQNNQRIRMDYLISIENKNLNDFDSCKIEGIE